MLLRLQLVLAALLAVFVAQPALASPEGGFQPGHRGHHGGGTEVKPAATIEDLPSTISLKVGEKRSFRDAGQTGCKDPSMVRMGVTEQGILTVVGLKQGSTELFMFGKPGTGAKKAPTADQLKNPNRITVNVTTR